jgi:PIN domain nuclease of toxin-antitoxin system
VGGQGLKLLLDTHVFVWAVDRLDQVRLSDGARDAIEDRHTQTFVSAASAWEIATKHRLGRLPAGGRIMENWRDTLARLRALDVAVTSAHGLLAGGFPAGHGDQFDRVLAARAIIEGATRVTTDRALAAFGADILW